MHHVSARELLVLFALCWGWCHAETAVKPVVLTEIKQGFSPKYYSLAIAHPEEFLPGYLETFTTANSLHKYLIYHGSRSHGLIHGMYKFLRRHYFSEGKEKILSIEEFFALFKKHERFTFILNDHEFLFTYTARLPWTALKSKHMILSNAAANLRSAGELYVKEHGGVQTLVVVNDSGSYRPRPHHMLGVVALLRAKLGLEEEDPRFQIKGEILYYTDDQEKQQFQRDHAQDLI